MSFSCKIILAGYKREDKTRRVYLQAIIDRKRVIVPVGLYVKDDDFDPVRQCIRKGHPNKKNYDAVLAQALARANDINAKFILQDRPLTLDEFRNQFTNTSAKLDLVSFMKREITDDTKISDATRTSRMTVVSDLHNFRSGKGIPFGSLSLDLLQQFQTYLRRQNNAEPTINKKLKILKQYLELAKAKGHMFKDPFTSVKIKTFKPNRRALQYDELKKFEEYYASPSCRPSHRKVLQPFLFSCYTGLRISDIKEITWMNVHGDLLVFTPVKTRYKNNEVTVPMSPQAKKYLPAEPPTSGNTRARGKQKVFKIFADPVMNRYLKQIADTVGVKKPVTYHFSRHTFGTMFSDGGDVVALQQIMGHASILTTMGYVHTNVATLQKAVKKRFGIETEKAGESSSL